MRTPNPSARDFTLGIEMSNPSANKNAPNQAHAVAIWAGRSDQHKLLASSSMPQGTRGSDGIMHQVESLCAAQGVLPSDIARVIVSIGPGGYTALRISSTTAKMLASTLNAQLIAVPSAKVGACSIDPQHRPALIALASKKNHTHASVVNADGSCVSVGIISCDALGGLGVRTIAADAHLPQSFVDAAASLGIVQLPLRLDARDLLQASQGIDPIDPVRLTPIYAREPDAVTQWRERASQ